MRWAVIGGGTAGCVVASRLSENSAYHVTLLEAGGVNVPLSSSYLDDLARPHALWDGLLVTDGDENRREYPQGRGLGGSSAVSGGVLSGAGSSSLPSESPGEDELGAVDRALLADPAAEVVALSRRQGSRMSAADVYLAPVLGRSNLDVLTGATAERIALDGARTVGVVLADGTVLGTDAVVCCCGAIFTPALLLRSGIDVPALGSGLQDHVGRVVEVPTDGDVHGLVTGAVLRRDSIEIVAMNHLGPDSPGRGGAIVGLLRNGRQGTVRVDESGWPVVDFGVLDDRDQEVLDRGVLLAVELLRQAGFADADVVDGLGGYAHATSSCAAVVDGRGAVHGYAGLFLCDASTLPELPASGTLRPVVAHAERFARRL